MVTQAIYKLADELTEQQVDNVNAGWNNRNDKEKKKTFDSLVRLGDSEN